MPSANDPSIKLASYIQAHSNDIAKGAVVLWLGEGDKYSVRKGFRFVEKLVAHQATRSRFSQEFQRVVDACAKDGVTPERLAAARAIAKRDGLLG